MNLVTTAEIKFCSLMSITYYVVLPILGVRKKNMNLVTFHSDMKQSIFILFQTILKTSIVKIRTSQVHLYIHTDMCVPLSAMISAKLKHNINL